MHALRWPPLTDISLLYSFFFHNTTHHRCLSAFPLPDAVKVADSISPSAGEKAANQANQHPAASPLFLMALTSEGAWAHVPTTKASCGRQWSCVDAAVRAAQAEPKGLRGQRRKKMSGTADR